MRIIRIFFSKTGEAAYISHLDLQRVMGRALRRSGLPVWYSQGFNPHIYITFALPLPLGQESVAESMDCKTESEEADFSAYLPRLNAALPRGIEATAIAAPVYGAGDIAAADYELLYDVPPARLAESCEAYARCEKAEVVRKTKRSETVLDLKELLPALAMPRAEEAALAVRLPAGSPLNINPELLAGFVEQGLGLGVRPARILRKRVFTKDEQAFV